MLSINFSCAEPHFKMDLPKLCRRKPNFIGPWQLRCIDDGDNPPELLWYWQRETADGLLYIFDY